jgi:hypothetical protein
VTNLITVRQKVIVKSEYIYIYIYVCVCVYIYTYIHKSYNQSRGSSIGIATGYRLDD